MLFRGRLQAANAGAKEDSDFIAIRFFWQKTQEHTFAQECPTERLQDQ